MHTKLKTLYNESSQHTQKYIKTLHIVLLMVAPVFCILPPSIVSFIAYSTTDLGNEALELPIPMW